MLWLHLCGDPAFSDVFHTIESSSAFNKAVLKMMNNFKWQRIGLNHDSLGFCSKT